MKFGKVLLYFIVSVSLTNSVVAQKFNNIPPIKYQDFTLKNGLRVINRMVLNFISRKNPPPQTDAENNLPTSTNTIAKNEALLAKQTANLPKPGPNPKLSLPPIEKTKLSNGLEIWMVKENKLPVVSMNLVIKSGIVSEPNDKLGVAALTNNLLRAGTKTRSALDISNQLQTLGTSISPSLGWESSTIAIQTLSKNFDQALDIYADVIVNPIFPEDELENRRQRTLGILAEQKSQPRQVASRTYSNVLYGDENPYSRPFFGVEESVKLISRNDLLEYYKANYRPNNSVLIVVGNVEKTSLLPKLEKSFSNWKPQPIVKTEIPKTTPLSKDTIYLIDRPDSTQSTIWIGQIGASRNNRDYFSMLVMNSILGSDTNARLGMNLRERKGYSYGVVSNFVFFKSSGHFIASGDVQTAVTKESIVEFMKELNGIRGDIPITNKELDYSKQNLIRRFPAGFEGIEQVSFQLSNLAIYELPDSYFNDYIQKVAAVTLADASQVANKYLKANRMAIVIVGDRKAIESGLQTLGYPIIILDADGNPNQ